MTRIQGLIFATIIILLFNCQNKSKRLVDSLNECSYDDINGNIEKELYPFDINKSDKSMILANCYNGVIMDSIVEFGNDKEINLIFSLTDKTSSIKYIPIPYKKGVIRNLKLYEYSIKTNIIKFKNGIKIGMQRHDFFKKMKRNYTDCNTYTINLGLCYYYFVFRNDSLIRIERKMEEI